MKWLLFSLLIPLGCNKGNDDDTGLEALCGDIDDNGGDTGDIPNILGLWSAQFALNMFDENCNGIDKSAVSYLTGPVDINGYVPDGLRLDIGSNSDRRLRGILSTTGGFAFAGQLEQGDGTFHLGLGGLLYTDQSMGERAVLNGSAFIGVDVDNDGQFDCDMRGDWIAFKSGS
jgi:hypothetical protein